MDKLDEGYVAGLIVNDDTNAVVGEFHVITYDDEIAHLRQLAGLLPDDAEVEQKDSECSCANTDKVEYPTMDFLKKLAVLDAQQQLNDITLDAMKSSGLSEKKDEDTDNEPELEREYLPISSHPGMASIKIRNPGKYADNPLALPEGASFKDYFKLLEGNEE